ncbi:MAG TPA: zinc ribbon domain-containing protein [Blastocatellia bacterium]|jgi:predicted nucleic acid-binding Zn ribbon protein|nr:zinc ribbon domain-containing protein [Blastocatellia bacterium]
MKTCPKCGAENLQTASSCRLCAVPLEAPDSLLGIRADVPELDGLPPTTATSGPAPEEDLKRSAYTTHTICPACQTINEQDWLFCQQCGQELLPKKRERPARSGNVESRETIEGLDTTGEAQSISTCNSCGTAQPSGSLYCTMCGEAISGLAPIPEEAGAARASGVFLELITDGREDSEVYPLEDTELILGRVEGNVTFSHDGYMSGRHARVYERDGRYYLSDENSRNGTFIRIDREIELKPGDTFLIGKQLLRFGKK